MSPNPMTLVCSFFFILVLIKSRATICLSVHRREPPCQSTVSSWCAIAQELVRTDHSLTCLCQRRYKPVCQAKRAYCLRKFGPGPRRRHRSQEAGGRKEAEVTVDSRQDHVLVGTRREEEEASCCSFGLFAPLPRSESVLH